MSSPNAPDLTPESNARDIAALTSAVNMLVSQFIRPAMQQANANRETLDEVIELVSRHAQGLLGQEQRLDQMIDRLESIEGIVAQNAQQIATTAQQQQANAQQISQNSEAIAAIAQRLEQFDTRLEETRQLVAKNSSDFAQMNTETKANLDRLIEENRIFREENRVFREESRAFRESQQSQLAAIIGNARRIDRIEQQAS